jgi:hypothetical protein
MPRRYKWLITPNQAARGSPINQRIVDETPVVALRILASGMMAGNTSPGKPWMRFTLHDMDLAEFPSVREWLDLCRDRVLTVFAESNFYQSLQVVYEDLGCFGTGPMIIYEDYDDVIRCYNSCAGEYYIAQNERLYPDTLYREFVQTTLQAARRFGLNNCSQTIKGAVKTAGAMLTKEVIVCHGIEPNDKFRPPVPGLGKMPYREVYWEYGSEEMRVLRVRGFHECPFIAPRWHQQANDAYGRSPGMDALGACKQLMVMTKRQAEAIDKLVKPPMLADVALKNEPASLLPGGVTYVPNLANNVGFKPVYEVKPDLAEMDASKKEVSERIQRVFFNDLFLMLEQMEGVQPRNMLEIQERKGEKLIQLGPVLERFQNEGLDPAIDRTFNIMMRAGLFPPPPEELKGATIKVEYESMLTEAQRALQTASIEQFSVYVGRVAALQPDVGDNVDWDETIDEYGNLTGIPVKLLRTAKDVAQIRAQRAQQQQQEQAMQQTLAGVQGAKVLGETNVGGGRNALEAMLNGAGQ